MTKWPEIQWVTDGITARVIYAPSDRQILLELWAGERLRERKSMLIDKFLSDLKVKFHREIDNGPDIALEFETGVIGE